MTEQPTPRASIDDLLSGPDATDSGMAGHDPAPAPGGGLDPGATPGEPGDGPAGPGTDFEIMPRPRRRPTRLTAALALLAATAAGFAGGLHAPGRPANTSAPSQSGGPAPGSGQAATGSLSPAGASLPGGNQPGSGGGITGTLKAVRGSVIYVTDAHGKTVTITISRSTTITNTATATPAQLSPGEPVTIQGTKTADGSYRAASIAAGQPATGGFLAPAGHP